MSLSLCVCVCIHVSVHSCKSKGLVEQHAGTNKTDVVCGESWRTGPGSRLGRWGAEGKTGAPGSTGRERGRGGKARGGAVWNCGNQLCHLSVEPGQVTPPRPEPQFLHL